MQQAEIFDAYPGPVIDSRDLLENPEGMLRALCAALGIPFSAAMLSWPPGPRDTDGVWGPYWYESVWRSTGFGPYRAPERARAGRARRAGRALPPLLRAAARRLRPSGPERARPGAR